MAVDDNQQPIEKHVSDAVSAGYDGIEIDAGENSPLDFLPTAKSNLRRGRVFPRTSSPRIPISIAGYLPHI